MKKLLVALAALCIAAPLGGCSSSMADAWARSDVVKSCRNGAVIVRDPLDGALIYYRGNGWSGVRGYLSPGVTPEEACD